MEIGQISSSNSCGLHSTKQKGMEREMNARKKGWKLLGCSLLAVLQMIGYTARVGALGADGKDATMMQELPAQATFAALAADRFGDDSVATAAGM